MLFAGVGGWDDNFTDTKLYDLATMPIWEGSAPFTGTYRPGESLRKLIGEPVAGTWTLDIEDSWPAEDPGTLQNWSLIAGDSMTQSSDVAKTIVDNASSTLLVDADPGAVVEAIHNIPTTISATSTGTGQGGTIHITATDSLAISGKNSGLFTKAENSVTGGDIVLHATDVTLSENATMSTTSFW